jgi:hypothetical protein
MWQSITTAPFDEDLELAVLDATDEYVALVFPCQRFTDGWISVATKKRININPTHWREWAKFHKSQ